MWKKKYRLLKIRITIVLLESTMTLQIHNHDTEKSFMDQQAASVARKLINKTKCTNGSLLLVQGSRLEFSMGLGAYLCSTH